MSALTDFKLSWTNCKRCTLCTTGKQVFSDGPETARILLVGEGPGAQEDAKGIPFVGPAGQLLTKILAENGIRRNDIYWTNSVRGWHRINGKTVKPLQQQMDACRPLLLKEIELIKPRFILLVGAVAAQQLLNHKSSLGPIVGQWFQYNNIPALVTYHTAAVLHTQAIDKEKSDFYLQAITRDIALLAREYFKPVSTVIVEQVSNKPAYLPF